MAALKGDWKSVMGMEVIQRPISRKKETTLHIAVAANQEDFVKNLVNKLNKEDLTVQNIAENTALTYAAATGNMNIAKVMLEKNEELPNLGRVKPLYMAALSGHSQMVQFLYPKTDRTVCQWVEGEAELFVTCVKGGLYGKHK